MNFNKQIILIVVSLFVTVFVSSMLLLIIGGKAAILGAFLIPCLLLTYQYPRWGLLAFLIYLPFSGTITYAIAGVFQSVGHKITYTAEYPLFHLAKDVFYFPALLAILMANQTFPQLQPKIKPLLIAICILLASCLLTFLFVNFPEFLHTKNLNSLLIGILGLKVLLGYIPLILCGYYLIRDPKDLFFLTRWLIIIIIICCSLCFIQYFLLKSGICLGNTNLPPALATKATLQAKCFVGGSLLYNPAPGLIRLPGTFVSPWQWGWFLISSSFITYAASFSDSSRRWQIVGWIGMAMVFGATLISGQRIAIFLVPVVFLVLLLLTEQDKKRLPLKLGIIFLLSFLIVNQVKIVQRVINNLIDRWNYSSPPVIITGRMIKLFRRGYWEWLGEGLGRASSAARRLGSTQLIETFYLKVIYEIGMLGFLAFLGVVTTLTVLTFKAYRSLKNPALRHIGICFWVFILFISYNPHYYPLAVDPVNIYYWFIAGILLKLPEIDGQTNLETEINLEEA